MPPFDELVLPSLSIAARVLWEYSKHDLSSSSSVSYAQMWQLIQQHQFHFTIRDVIAFILGSNLKPEDCLLLINLDEINALFGDKQRDSLSFAYLQHSLRQLVSVSMNGQAFLYPVLTATKALKVKDVIKLSGCSFMDISLPLLQPSHVAELIWDLHSRAVSSIKASSSAALTSSLSALSLSSSSAPAVASSASADTQVALPPILSNLVELMAGHPRLLEHMLFYLGRPDGALNVWQPVAFVNKLEEFRQASPGNVTTFRSLLQFISGSIISRYSAFKEFVQQPIMNSIIPQLTGYTLWEWPVHRQLEFKEDAFSMTVHELEEDGIVFLTPIQRGHAHAASGSATSASAPSFSSATVSSQSDVSAVDRFRLVIPFIWLHVIYQHHAMTCPSTVVPIELVQELTCCMSAGQNEYLTSSVLALKCFCLAKMQRTTIGVHELLLGRIVDDDIMITLPALASTTWPVRKLRSNVTKAGWERFKAAARYPDCQSGPPPDRFFLNGEHSSSWDGCALTVPPIFIQDKQSLVSRGLRAQGKAVQTRTWESIEKEINKALVEDALFFFCCEDRITGLPNSLPSRMIVLQHHDLAAFFGPVLAARKQISLWETPGATNK